MKTDADSNAITKTVYTKLFRVSGLYGLNKIRSSTASTRVKFIFSILFIGIFFTAFGSAYYHYKPDNNSLAYDRIPMTVVFMALLSSIIAGWINVNAGFKLLAPSILIGIGSVIYWKYSESKGTGDLRFYGFIQFFPVLFIPLIILLFSTKENNKGLNLLVWVIGWYLLAKVLEFFDKEIYKFTDIISGHSLKHLAAAAATWYIVKFFDCKYDFDRTCIQ